MKVIKNGKSKSKIKRSKNTRDIMSSRQTTGLEEYLSVVSGYATHMVTNGESSEMCVLLLKPNPVKETVKTALLWFEDSEEKGVSEEIADALKQKYMWTTWSHPRH